MYKPNDIVILRIGTGRRFIQVQSGPFQVTKDPYKQYTGWVLEAKDGSEPVHPTVFTENEAVLALPEEVEEFTNGPLNLHEVEF